MLPVDLLAVESLAAQRNLIFDRIGTEEGLSQGIVTAIAQDAEGFVWVGTQEGLNRFDGYHFKHYYHSSADEKSLSRDYVRSLFFDSKNQLWVGTEGGIDLFDSVTQTFSKKLLGRPDEAVYAILEDRDERLWIGTELGLYLWNELTETFGRVDTLSSLGSVRSLMLQRNGHLLIGTEENGIYVLQEHSTHPSKIDVDLLDSDVRDLLEDQYGMIWAATFNGGVTRFDQNYENVEQFNSLQHESLASSRVRSLLEDQDGHVWFATDNGLHLLVGERKFIRYTHDLSNPRSLSDNTVLTLFQDAGGVVWAGTFNGINKWNARVELFPHFRRPVDRTNSSESNNVTSFAGSPHGDVWVGTFSGLIKWDAELGLLVSLDPNIMGLRDRRVMSLAWHKDDIWAGTMTSGINVISGDVVTQVFRSESTNSTSLSSNAITKIVEDSSGKIWVSTYGGGVNRYIGNGNFERFPKNDDSDFAFSSLRCLDIVEGPGGDMWIATQGGGLVVLDPFSGRTRIIQANVDSERDIPSNNVIALLPSESGMWIGTVDKGLSYLDYKSELVTRYTKQDGLASDSVYGLLLDGSKNVWVSGGKGLSVLDHKARSVRTFDSSHGLQSSDFNSGAYLKLNDGSLLFGGNNGFNAFYPQNIKLNEYEPPVHITEVRLFNKPINVDGYVWDQEQLEFSHDDSVLSFSFAALDFTAPKKNKYRYKLEGFDRDWVDHKGGREVTYTNLDAGQYVFRVQGSNNDGLWNEQGASLSFVVAPAPWLTWWAYSIYTIAAMLVLGLLFHSNSRRLQRLAEKEYSERLQLYIESLEEASDGIMIADSNGNLVYANHTTSEGLSKSAEEIVGEKLYDVLFSTEEDRSKAREALELEGRYHGEVQLESFGKTVTHEVTIAEVKQPSRNEHAYVGISRDVTQRKITETELEAYRRNLEYLVEERTQALQKEIAENKAIQTHLAESLQEKELLLKEVHHRVKNNMQVISSLLSIQAEGASDEIYTTMLNESQQRIKSMALIHETLYQSKDLLKIDFQEYIETLSLSLSRSYSVPGVSVHVSVNVEDVELDLETAVPCGLIINELVSNSLKHAFLDREGLGVISIDFVSKGCFYELRIADNGKGLPAKFDPTTNVSMGMEIVSILTSQLEGKLRYHNEEGAVFEIQFPRSIVDV